jgi:hypothetical protein
MRICEAALFMDWSFVVDELNQWVVVGIINKLLACYLHCRW